MTLLDRALRLHALGLSLIPLKPRSKEPDGSVLPLDAAGKPVWAPYQTQRASESELHKWFGNGVARNVGVVLGYVSDVVVVDPDSPDEETWCAANLPVTPMQTRSARGTHRYYRRPPGATLPAFIRTTTGLEIELRRDGHYVVAPGSIHPSGHVYTEVEPWPSTLDDLPFLPLSLLGGTAGAHTSAAPLPTVIGEGSRNNVLFTEGCRLRRYGWSEKEIAAALAVINRERCIPPVASDEVSAIAHSCAEYDAARDTFPTTETGDAEFFTACHGDTVRYDHRRGRWLLFNGNIWVPQTNGEIHRLALEAVRARQRLAVGDKARMTWAFKGESRSGQSNMLALAQNLLPLADAGDCWDTDPWLLGAPNGVIDLRTGALRPGRPEDLVTMSIRPPFDPAATCPLYDKTVGEIFENNGDLVAYFDRYVGYSLTGDCREESLALCYGDGANGKGTLMNTLGWLLGDYADDLPFSAFELTTHSGIPNDVAKIVGKRFITSSEAGETVRLNEARVKALTGRDPITARFLRQEFFTFQPVAKFWLATNHKPEIRDDSEGFWRRLHLIPFAASFIGREDRTLKDRLREELPGILARAVRGCLQWRREGLKAPDVVVAATRGYRTESMPLARFLDECCVVQDKAMATFGDLFAAYVRWSSEDRLGKNEFNAALHRQFKVVTKDQRATFVGVGLIDPRREQPNAGGM